MVNRLARRHATGTPDSRGGESLALQDDTGGLPLVMDGQVVGAVGVSGGNGQQDQTVAEAAAGAF